jgi:hypothetical protein
VLRGEFVEAIFEFVVPGSESVQFVVGVLQFLFHVLRLLNHAPPPFVMKCRCFGGAAACRSLRNANVAQGPGGFKHSREALRDPTEQADPLNRRRQ